MNKRTKKKNSKKSRKFNSKKVKIGGSSASSAIEIKHNYIIYENEINLQDALKNIKYRQSNVTKKQISILFVENKNNKQIPVDSLLTTKNCIRDKTNKYFIKLVGFKFNKFNLFQENEENDNDNLVARYKIDDETILRVRFIYEDGDLDEGLDDSLSGEISKLICSNIVLTDKDDIIGGLESNQITVDGSSIYLYNTKDDDKFQFNLINETAPVATPSANTSKSPSTPSANTPTSVPTEINTINDLVINSGGDFKFDDVASDGDCFFHCVLKSLSSLQEKGRYIFLLDNNKRNLEYYKHNNENIQNLRKLFLEKIGIEKIYKTETKLLIAADKREKESLTNHYESFLSDSGETKQHDAEDHHILNKEQFKQFVLTKHYYANELVIEFIRKFLNIEIIIFDFETSDEGKITCIPVENVPVRSNGVIFLKLEETHYQPLFYQSEGFFPAVYGNNGVIKIPQSLKDLLYKLCPNQQSDGLKKYFESSGIDL